MKESTLTVLQEVLQTLDLAKMDLEADEFDVLLNAVIIESAKKFDNPSWVLLSTIRKELGDFKLRITSQNQGFQSCQIADVLSIKQCDVVQQKLGFIKPVHVSRYLVNDYKPITPKPCSLEAKHE